MDRRLQRSGQHRVVEVLGSTYGSGYAISDRLVLTARHVLAAAGQDVVAGTAVTVRIAGEEQGRRATVAWVSRSVGDAALLAVDGAPWADAPDDRAMRWGRVDGDSPVPCRAWGFPAAQATPSGDQEFREIAEMRGLVGSITAMKRYEIDVQSAAPVLTSDGTSLWRGMSGAVLMDSRRRILGVVISHRLRYGGGRLQAAPVERLFEDPEFCELVAADERRIESVSAEDAVLLDAPGVRSILRTDPAAGVRLDELSDYQLLQARFQAVEFIGREDERRDLRAWCAAGDAVSLGLVAGAGGAGKTRLGFQLCREVADQGWSAGFADEEVLDAALGGNKVVDVVWPTLLVLDYPDRLTDRTIAWIESMGARRFGPKLRFLLLDRVPGDGADPAAARADLTWWANAKRITRSDFIARPRLVVQLRTGGLTGSARSQHLEYARRAFGGGHADLSGLDLSDHAYRNPLKVHVAALLAIRGELYPTAAEVMSRFLDREMGVWLQQRAKHGIGDVAPPLARQIVALATLARPQIDAVPQLLSAIPDMADTRGLLRPNIRNWLVELFGVGSRVSALEPDLLAEELLATTPDLDQIVVGLYQHPSSTAEHAASMLESLSLAAGGRASVRDVLLRFLAEDLGTLATQAADAPDGRLPGLIEIALAQFQDDDAVAVLGIAAAGSSRIPHPQDSYRRLMNRLARLALAWCEAQPPHIRTGQVRVDALTDMAAEAALSGELAEASELADEALAACRSLGPDESRRLARAWYNAGTCRVNSGGLRHALQGLEALATAAALSRRSAADDTAALIEHSETLVNLGSCLADLDDHAAALDASVAAIELRIGRDYAGLVLEPLAEPLVVLAWSLRGDPRPRPALGGPQPFRPLCWSQSAHRPFSSAQSFALIRLAARLCTGLAGRIAPHIRALPADAAQAKAAALSDSLRRLVPDLSDSLSAGLLTESIELRRQFVTDDRSRAEFAKFLGVIAEELLDDDHFDRALAAADESIAEFQELDSDTFGRYHEAFGKALLVKVGALGQRGMMDPLRLARGGLDQSAAAEFDEIDQLLRRLPESSENASVLTEVRGVLAVHLLMIGEVDAAAAALAIVRERYPGSAPDSGESDDEAWAFVHVLTELLAGHPPYEWLTSMSDGELQELEPESWSTLDQAMLEVAEDIGEFLAMMANALVVAERPDRALGFANQAIDLARFWMRFEPEADPGEQSEVRMQLSMSLTILSGLRAAVPEEALRYAREALDAIDPVPEHELMLPLVRGGAEVALVRATLAGDPSADVVAVAERAMSDLARATEALAEIDESGSFASSSTVTATLAEAQVHLANAYLTVNRPSDTIDQAVAARELLLGMPQTRPVFAFVLMTHMVEGMGEYALGRRDGALTAFDQVIRMHGDADLAPSSPAGLVEAAFMAALCHQELGRPEEALRNSQLAMEAWRSPDLVVVPVLQGRVAMNLMVQAVALSALGDPDEAYRVSGEAVQLARTAPNAVVALVKSLHVRADLTFGRGGFAEAASLLDEALTAAEGHVVPPFDLALVTLGYGNCQAALGDLGAALNAFLEAAEIFSDIPGQTSPMVGALIRAAACHRELGDHLAGLPLLAMAVDRCRELVVDRESANALADAFTAALWEVVVCQDLAADGGAADAAAAEGIDFFRRWELAQRGQTQALLHYSDMLSFRSHLLALQGRDREALPFRQEATAILRGLVSDNPEAFRPAFLESLAGQGELLHRLGRYAEAATAENEYIRWAGHPPEE